MKSYLELKRKDLKRRRRERYIIVSLCFLISILTYFGLKLIGWGLNFPLSTNLLLFGLINLNLILLLLLLYLTVRNLVKLIFERKKNVLGSHLRTKLVIAFMTLSLIPTVILFFISIKFISSSIEFWFNFQIDRSLKNSLELGRQYYKQTVNDLLYVGSRISRTITRNGYMLRFNREKLKKMLSEKRKEHNLFGIEVFYYSRNIFSDYKRGFDISKVKKVLFKDKKILKEVLYKKKPNYIIHSFNFGDIVYGFVPIFSRKRPENVIGILALSKLIPKNLTNRLNTISKGIQEYKQLKMMKQPIKISNIITISIVTLLIIFSSIWFGFYLSKEITVPVKELVEATNKIASGDYEVYIDMDSNDEIGYLVNSFNKMTEDLRQSKKRLEEAYNELQKSNIELEKRKIYMEIVLKNIAAGVISIDPDGRIQTINRSAENLLELEADKILGRTYNEVLPKAFVKIIDEMVRDKDLILKGTVKRQENITVEEKNLNLLFSLNFLRDEDGNNIGTVCVFEDLTEIEKAHRMTVWREVARRIAHEVKNPLTPIQLSAQRLKKRLSEKLDEKEKKLLKECTDMIVNQVEELKALVNEFHRFARMPTCNPAPFKIEEIIDEIISLTKDAHKSVEFIFNKNGDIPILRLDKAQMKRAILNIIENAIEAMDGKGEVKIGLRYEKELNIVKIEIADTGPGIPPEYRARLFEPYFSTKKHGTGLGLTIANTIISDHDGFIRVYENKPKGTCFVIELPVRDQV